MTRKEASKLVITIYNDEPSARCFIDFDSQCECEENFEDIGLDHYTLSVHLHNDILVYSSVSEYTN